MRNLFLMLIAVVLVALLVFHFTGSKEVNSSALLSLAAKKTQDNEWWYDYDWENDPDGIDQEVEWDNNGGDSNDGGSQGEEQENWVCLDAYLGCMWEPGAEGQRCDDEFTACLER